MSDFMTLNSFWVCASNALWSTKQAYS